MGVTSLLRLLRTDSRRGVSVSVSVSDGRACLFERCLPMEDAPFREKSATLSSPAIRSLFLDFGLDVGGGIELVSSSPAPSSVPSWLLGISMMPRLVRFILERAANILRERGSRSRAKMSMSWDFFAEAG